MRNITIFTAVVEENVEKKCIFCVPSGSSEHLFIDEI